MTTAALPDVMNLSGRGTPVTVQDMIDRDKLISVERGRELLSTTEPLAWVDFETGSSIRFRLEDEWNRELNDKHGTDPVDAWVNIQQGQNDGTEYRLTKDAVISATGACGMGKAYVAKAPGFLTADALNYWYRGGMDKGCRLMVVGADQVGAAITRESVVPFSNLQLLEQAITRIEARHPGMPVYLDASKMAHSLRQTYIQLVIPDLARQMTNTGEDNDQWWGGLQVTNSQTADVQTQISGFLYRMLCTNGMVDIAANADSWNRRSGGSNEEEVYAWAADAVDAVLGGLEHSFESVQALVNIPLEGEIGATARDVFDQYRVPVRARERIVNELVETNNLTMYGLVNAITAGANGDVPTNEQQHLMSVGGDVMHHTDRCGSCRRILPEGLVPSQD
jgi:hypothetical protein